MVHLECLKVILWLCCVCYNVVGDIAFVRFAGMARPNQPAGASRGSDGLHGNRRAGMDRASACLSTSSRGGAMGSEARMRRAVPDTVRLFEASGLALRLSAGRSQRGKPGMSGETLSRNGACGGVESRHDEAVPFVAETRVARVAIVLRDAGSVGPRTHAASQNG